MMVRRRSENCAQQRAWEVINSQREKRAQITHNNFHLQQWALAFFIHFKVQVELHIFDEQQELQKTTTTQHESWSWAQVES